MKTILQFLVIILLVSCNTVRVNYDYDKETDFSNYGTYGYYSDLNTGLSELDTKRLLDAIDTEMQLKGARFSEDPDFFINIQSRSFQAARNSSVGVGVGGTGSNVGGGVSVGIPIGGQNLEREIRFDFIDSKKETLFWQAISQGTFKENVSSEAREERLKGLTAKVFSKFPPK